MTPTAVGTRMGAGAAGALAVYASVLRPRIRWLGTRTSGPRPTPEMTSSPVAVVGAMATTIAARPERVWPWLVQMGCDRAGFYSFDRLDNGGRPSADRIHTQWQNLREGDRIASVPDGSRWFDVAFLAPSGLSSCGIGDRPGGAQLCPRGRIAARP